ncbi:MAG: hypothetical protein PUD56_09705 [Prevotella sp.]|nr:hypothetical protein [Prevotella sp.]
MYILSVTSVTPVTPLDLKWHVFWGGSSPSGKTLPMSEAVR